MLRADIACGWFGIQPWIGGFALYQMVKLWLPAIDSFLQLFPVSWSLQTGSAIMFLLFWVLNMYVVYLGVDNYGNIILMPTG